MNIYAIERTQEIERELRANRGRLPEPEGSQRRPVFGPLAARAGRALRRAGEGLESWGTVSRDDGCLPEQTR